MLALSITSRSAMFAARLAAAILARDHGDVGLVHLVAEHQVLGFRADGRSQAPAIADHLLLVVAHVQGEVADAARRDERIDAQAVEHRPCQEPEATAFPLPHSVTLATASWVGR